MHRNTGLISVDRSVKTESLASQTVISKQMEAAGGVCFLSQFSWIHAGYSMAHMAHRIGDSIRNNQFRYYSNPEKGPIGFCSWTYLSDETLKEVLETGREISREEFNQGENLFVTEFIAPFGHLKLIVRDLRNNRATFFHNKEVAYALRVAVGQAPEKMTFRKSTFFA